MLMRLTDMVLAFPVFFIAVMVLALGPSIPGLVAVIGATRGRRPLALCAPSSCACARSISVAAARGPRRPELRVMARHILPNVVAVIVISVTLRVGVSILAEASLSYLGLGRAAAHRVMGQPAADGREYLRSAWWVSLGSSLVFAAVMAFNLLGDGLRDVRSSDAELGIPHDIRARCRPRPREPWRRAPDPAGVGG